MRYNVFGKNSAGSAVSDLLVEIYRQKLVFSQTQFVLQLVESFVWNIQQNIPKVS